MKYNKSSRRKFFVITLIVALVFSVNTMSVFATEEVPSAKQVGSNSVTFCNFSNLNVGESIEVDVFDSNGNPAKVGIERIANDAGTRAGANWKIWFTGISINCHFYMNVTNNAVTSVYDYKIVTIGCAYSNAKLTKTSSYGKLAFDVTGPSNIFSGNCWLKGTVTGSGNNVTTTWSM